MAKRALRVEREVSLEDAISEAWNDIEELAGEMREWADSMEEKFSQTEKYETVSGTADTLEGLHEPSVPDELKHVMVKYVDLPPKRRGYSRADRCGQATYILQQCVEALNFDSENALASQAKDLSSDLSDLISEAESVEFPGMYG